MTGKSFHLNNSIVNVNHLYTRIIMLIREQMDIRDKVSKSSRLFLGLTLGLLVFTSGCAQGDPVGTVKGTASVKGKPYKNAAVMFVSIESGHGSGGDLQADGSFQLADPLPVGSYTVYFAPKSIAVEDATAAPVPIHMDKSVPEKYWNESSSDIKVDVKAGENIVPIEVK
jgi:hypothetical protein